MDNFFELMELGVPLGMGVYIGFESIRLLVEIVSKLITIIITKLLGDDDI